MDLSPQSRQETDSLLAAMYYRRNVRVAECVDGYARALSEMPEFVMNVEWEWSAPAEFLKKSCRDRMCVYKDGRNVMIRTKVLPVNGVSWETGDFLIKIDPQTARLLIK
jgi:hypothetical protein